MSAAALQTLFAVEASVEPAGEAFLETQGIEVFTSRTEKPLPDRRIEFQLQLGNVTGHMKGWQRGTLYDRWNAHFVFHIITPRSKRGLPDVFHDQQRAALRVAMQYAIGSFNPTNLPYHTILNLMEYSTDPNVDLDQDLDVSEIRFASVIGIRDSAWPAQN